jgi:mono/diheme cytochrome c family protein
MSAAASHHDAHAEHEHRPVWQYLALAAFLTVLTGIELGPLFDWYNLPIPALMVLSIVKFFLVAAIFMHLWDDHPVFTQLFGVPLLASGLMVIVLMGLFYSFEPSPKDDILPVTERWYGNWNSECQSWLRSSQSRHWYCASPAIDKDRMAAWSVHSAKPIQKAAPKLDGLSEADKIAKLKTEGESLYKANCAACHQDSGAGIPGAFPPLAGSDYAGYKDKTNHAKIIINGLNGEIEVNGVKYNGAMASFSALSDFEIAAIATYERNSWGNADGVVLPEDVKAAR